MTKGELYSGARLDQGRHARVCIRGRVESTSDSDPARPCCFNQRGDNVTVFRAEAKTGGVAFTGQHTPVGSPASVVFVDLAKAG